MAGNLRYVPVATGYIPGKARVFLPFEDRSRDLSGLLDFGTVVQIFDSKVRWQLTSETANQYAIAVREYFRAHAFTDTDAVVAIGDPLVIAATIHAAAEENAGRVTVLRWDRLRCASCRNYDNRGCATHVIIGRYMRVDLQLPLDRTRGA